MLQINSKFKPLFNLDDNIRYITLSGGRSSGKSFVACLYAIKKSYDKGNKILFTRYSGVKVKDSIISSLNEVLSLIGVKNDFKATQNGLINLSTGVEIICKGIKGSTVLETKESLKSIANISIWICDEANQIPTQDIFDVSDDSIRRKDMPNRIVLIFNGLITSHWLYAKFFNTTCEDHLDIHTTYKDNKDNISHSLLRKISKMKDDDPDYYKFQYLGQHTSTRKGAIYSNWTPILIEPDLTGYNTRFGLDLGYNDPTSLVQIWYKPNDPEIYVKQHIYQSNLNVDQLSVLISQCNPKNHLIIGDNSGKQILQTLQYKGHNVNKCHKTTVQQHIQMVKAYNLNILPSKEQPSLIYELENYSFDEDGEPIDDFNHALDSLYYAISI